MRYLDELSQVFDLEINTLVAVRDSLGDSYAEAVEVLFTCQGQVVITGMGKSGLIAQKIASTMASTGTPATFLHSGDGLHGDVGIIRSNDVLVAISKSGETAEMLDLMLSVKRIGIPVVSITASLDSTLGRQSDIVLYTPVAEEACPLDLAPTSSTTAALVVGDALAMTLMKKRGFTNESFAMLHPGGQLGKRLLMTVRDIMRGGENNPVIGVNDSIQDLLYVISAKRCGATSVIDDDGKLLGLVTDRDIRKVLEDHGDIFSLGIKGVMNPSPTHIYSNEKAFDALNIMEQRDRPILVVPVLEQGTDRVVGMVHLHDLVAQGL
ncbi:MAG: KpsF/GutQ family sugar-phosphate isomerase [SAR202 cluster bacterium]|nr:KpsF/GutQ family sugar-phosphate isomerase [SAR202 cluster bacterium]|tara:strand:- start:391 stop:1359 length:969 start_codon:yes stop_codon:yes gene_type:complete